MLRIYDDLNTIWVVVLLVTKDGF
ncbi:hypothetical protein DSUL_20288 [Desulfovibrionales bacterium]